MDEQGNIRHGPRPAIPVYQNKKMYGIAAVAVFIMFLAGLVRTYGPGLPDPCTLKKLTTSARSEMLSLFGDSQTRRPASSSTRSRTQSGFRGKVWLYPREA